MSREDAALLPAEKDFTAVHALELMHAATAPKYRAQLSMVMPFVMMHVAGVAALFVEPSWNMALLCMGMYLLGMFGVTAGYHRYFAHRAFKTSRGLQFALAWLATMSCQKGVLWWAGNHRHHHKHSDDATDLHSPIQHGFLWSHVGWIVDTRADETPFEKIQDYAKFPELCWLNKHFLVPPVVTAVTLLLLGGLPALMWGFFLSTLLLFHGTFTINSLAHVFGTRRYLTKDTSKNNGWLALITLGEGWHNNHHHYCSSANQGFYWWEIDVTFYLIRLMEKLHLVWDVRTPPSRVFTEGMAGTR